MDPDISIWQKTGHFYFALTGNPRGCATSRSYECPPTGNGVRELGVETLEYFASEDRCTDGRIEKAWPLRLHCSINPTHYFNKPLIRLPKSC